MPAPNLARRLQTLVFVVSLTMSFMSRPASAGFEVPSPTRSFVDANLCIEPGGSIPLTVTVRSTSGFIIPNSQIAIDLCACPGVAMCPTPPGPGPAACSPRAFTVNGTAVLYPKGGGGCAAINVGIYADGVLLATRRVTSPDQNGDLVVDMTDLEILNAKFGTSDMTGDLNGDGMVSIPDRAIWLQCMDNSCVLPTGTRRSTWGELKIRYR